MKIVWDQMRPQVGRSDPFTWRITAFIVFAVVLGTVAVGVADFFVQGKQLQCTPEVRPEYESGSCSAATLLFASTYYTASTQASQGIGVFPWIMGGFSNETAGTSSELIDYSVQRINYTGATNQCEVFFTSITLHVDTGASTTQACFYCDGNPKVTCTLVDSERSQTTLASLSGYSQLLGEYAAVMLAMETGSASLFPNENITVLSLTYSNISTPSNAPAGALPPPFNASKSVTSVGTLGGGLVLFPDDSNAARASLAAEMAGLGLLVQQTTSADLENRPFLTNYNCQRCQKVFKSWTSIAFLIVQAISAIVGTGDAILITVLGWTCKADQEALRRNNDTVYAPSALSLTRSGGSTPIVDKPEDEERGFSTRRGSPDRDDSADGHHVRRSRTNQPTYVAATLVNTLPRRPASGGGPPARR